MEVYLVGGAVRDWVLGREAHERDWVVVGGSVAQMVAQGYRQVGKDFPVFLHPQSGEEYALARTERKQGQGYHGFVCDSGAQVTLPQDLMRRDLTINAMALPAALVEQSWQVDSLIDPYGGLRDCQERVLRHVSPAFTEDPLRVLRLARFAAQLPEFAVAPATQQMLKDMVAQGELQTISPERVWVELQKALSAPAPTRFFEVMSEAGALHQLLPELSQISACPWQVLGENKALCTDIACSFAAVWGQCELELLRSGTRFMRIPTRVFELAKLVARLRHQWPKAQSASAIFHLCEQGDAFRRPARWQQWLQVVVALHGGQRRADALSQVLAQCQSIDSSAWQDQGLKGRALGEALQQARQGLFQHIDWSC